MKHSKLLSILSATLLGLSAAVFPPAELKSAELNAQAKWIDITDDNLVVSKNSTGLTIESYNGAPPQAPLSIQSSYWDMPVTQIAANAFRNTNITSVYVPGSVTKIGKHAFNGCKKLVKAELAGTSGSCQIGNYAFYDCTKLKNIIMRKPTYTRDGSTSTPGRCGIHVFSNCTSLTQINSANVISYSSVGGFQKPRLKPTKYVTNDIKNIIKTFMVRSENVKFVNDYCTDLCNWIRDTETKPWMSDAVKARQYHDWLIDHLEYEDKNHVSGEGYETERDPENLLYSSVFLSYGLGIRGLEMGETVCEGFSKAFTMLLKSSDIESYVIGSDHSPEFGDDVPGHAWNLIKLNGKYYQCDITRDNEYTDKPNVSPKFNAIYYRSFIKSNAQMNSLHYGLYDEIRVVNPKQSCFDGGESGYETGYVHPYANYSYTNNGATQNALIARCNTTFADSNEDGLLDGDWSFDGVRNQNDNAYYRAACWKWNRTSISQNDMTFLLQEFKVWKKSPEEVYQEWVNS